MKRALARNDATANCVIPDAPNGGNSTTTKELLHRAMPNVSGVAVNELAVAAVARAISRRCDGFGPISPIRRKRMALRVIFAAGAMLLALAPLARAEGDAQA